MLKVRPFLFWLKGFTCFKDKSHYRSSHRSCSERKRVLRDFTKFSENHLCQSLFFNKVAGFSLWKQRLWGNFVKFLRTPFLQNTSGRLLQSLSKDRTFLIKLYKPEENLTVGQISGIDNQCFLCSVVCILNSER